MTPEILILKTLILMRTLNATKREKMIHGERVHFAPKTLEQIDAAIEAARKAANVERWVFTGKELEECDDWLRQFSRSDDMFVTGGIPCGEPVDGEVPRTELGVIVHRNGEVTNRWADGTVGVPSEIKKLAAEEESLIRCSRAADLAEHWTDVVHDGNGQFVCFYR